jgi:hypothetical protein
VELRLYPPRRNLDAGAAVTLTTTARLADRSRCCVLGFILYLSAFQSFQGGRMYPSGGQKGQALLQFLV